MPKDVNSGGEFITELDATEVARFSALPENHDVSEVNQKLGFDTTINQTAVNWVIENNSVQPWQHFTATVAESFGDEIFDYNTLQAAFARQDFSGLTFELENFAQAEALLGEFQTLWQALATTLERVPAQQIRILEFILMLFKFGRVKGAMLFSDSFFEFNLDLLEHFPTDTPQYILLETILLAQVDHLSEEQTEQLCALLHEKKRLATDLGQSLLQPFENLPETYYQQADQLTNTLRDLEAADIIARADELTDLSMNHYLVWEPALEEEGYIGVEIELLLDGPSQHRAKDSSISKLCSQAGLELGIDDMEDVAELRSGQEGMVVDVGNFNRLITLNRQLIHHPDLIGYYSHHIHVDRPNLRTDEGVLPFCANKRGAEAYETKHLPVAIPRYARQQATSETDTFLLDHQDARYHNILEMSRHVDQMTVVNALHEVAWQPLIENWKRKGLPPVFTAAEQQDFAMIFESWRQRPQQDLIMKVLICALKESGPCEGAVTAVLRLWRAGHLPNLEFWFKKALWQLQRGETKEPLKGEALNDPQDHPLGDTRLIGMSLADGLALKHYMTLPANVAEPQTLDETIDWIRAGKDRYIAISSIQAYGGPDTVAFDDVKDIITNPDTYQAIRGDLINCLPESSVPFGEVKELFRHYPRTNLSFNNVPKLRSKICDVELADFVDVIGSIHHDDTEKLLRDMVRHKVSFQTAKPYILDPTTDYPAAFRLITMAGLNFTRQRARLLDKLGQKGIKEVVERTLGAANPDIPESPDAAALRELEASRLSLEDALDFALNPATSERSRILLVRHSMFHDFDELDETLQHKTGKSAMEHLGDIPNLPLWLIALIAESANQSLIQDLFLESCINGTPYEVDYDRLAGVATILAVDDVFDTFNEEVRQTDHIEWLRESGLRPETVWHLLQVRDLQALKFLAHPELDADQKNKIIAGLNNGLELGNIAPVLANNTIDPAHRHDIANKVDVFTLDDYLNFRAEYTTYLTVEIALIQRMEPAPFADLEPVLQDETIPLNIRERLAMRAVKSSDYKTLEAFLLDESVDFWLRRALMWSLKPGTSFKEIIPYVDAHLAWAQALPEDIRDAMLQENDTFNFFEGAPQPDCPLSVTAPYMSLETDNAVGFVTMCAAKATQFDLSTDLESLRPIAATMYPLTAKAIFESLARQGGFKLGDLQTLLEMVNPAVMHDAFGEEGSEENGTTSQNMLDALLAADQPSFTEIGAFLAAPTLPQVLREEATSLRPVTNAAELAELTSVESLRKLAETKVGLWYTIAADARLNRAEVAKVMAAPTIPRELKIILINTLNQSRFVTSGWQSHHFIKPPEASLVNVHNGEIPWKEAKGLFTGGDNQALSAFDFQHLEPEDMWAWWEQWIQKIAFHGADLDEIITYIVLDEGLPIEAKKFAWVEASTKAGVVVHDLVEKNRKLLDLLEDKTNVNNCEDLVELLDFPKMPWSQLRAALTNPNLDTEAKDSIVMHYFKARPDDIVTKGKICLDDDIDLETKDYLTQLSSPKPSNELHIRHQSGIINAEIHPAE